MNLNKNKSNLKIFFIKLISITLTIIVIINLTYNLIFADKLENLNNFLSINNKESIEQIKNKIRIEIRKGLAKDNILNQEDKPDHDGEIGRLISTGLINTSMPL